MNGAPAGLLRTGRPIAAVLAAARTTLDRLSPLEVLRAMADGALVVDTRTDGQRSEQGNLPGALVIDRTVLEWRLDPTSPDRIPEAADHEALVIVVCRQGYSSSIAAAALQDLGLFRATDMVGGMENWLAQGLPVTWEAADVRR